MAMHMGHILGTMNEMEPDVGQTPDAPRVLSSLAVVSMPWVFTQHQPLSASQFIDEAKRRGVDLDTSALRQLYRHSVLIPFLYVGNRAVGPVLAATGPDPKHPGGTLLTEFRYARSKGRLSDLALTEFRPALALIARSPTVTVGGMVCFIRGINCSYCRRSKAICRK